MNMKLKKKVVRTKSYIINQTPNPLSRPRFSSGGRAKMKVYDEQQHLKMSIGINLRRQHGDSVMFQGPLHVDMLFYFPLPRDKRKSENYTKGIYHIFKPDLDNLIKLIGDVIVDCEIIQEDAIICSINSQKMYAVEGTEPRTEFTISQLER